MKTDYEKFRDSSPENAALLDAEARVLAAEEACAALREENERLREKTNLIADRLGAALREREEARAEVKRKDDLILDFDYWHSHQATAKEAPDELIVEARRIRAARSGSEEEPKP